MGCDCVYLYICACECVCVDVYTNVYKYMHTNMASYLYGVATISRLLNMIELFCKRAL